MPTIDFLDGGTATALETHGLSLDTSLWSAAAVLDAPDAIRHVHTSFLNANSLIIESCTYQITPHSFGSTENAADAVHAAIDIARKAIASAAGSASHAQLALSLGPYAVAQADGSEYTGVYHSLPSDTTFIDNLKYFHLTRLRMVRDTVDILLFETIPLLSEVRAVRQAVREWRQERENEHTTYTRNTPPLYISLVFPDGTLPGSKLASEKTDTMDDVVDAVFNGSGAQVSAIGINCTKPKYLEGLVSELVESMHRAHITHGPKLMLYPDGGRNFNTESRTWEDSEADATESTWAKTVVDAAAIVMEDTASPFSGVIVGGCCMTSAEHIKCLHEACRLRGWLDV